MQYYLTQHGFEDQIMVDSAGTIGHHTGHGADERMKAAGAKRGYSLLSRSRKITHTDLGNVRLGDRHGSGKPS